MKPRSLLLRLRLACLLVGLGVYFIIGLAIYESPANIVEAGKVFPASMREVSSLRQGVFVFNLGIDEEVLLNRLKVGYPFGCEFLERLRVGQHGIRNDYARALHLQIARITFAVIRINWKLRVLVIVEIRGIYRRWSSSRVGIVNDHLRNVRRQVGSGTERDTHPRSFGIYCNAVRTICEAPSIIVGPTRGIQYALRDVCIPSNDSQRNYGDDTSYYWRTPIGPRMNKKWRGWACAGGHVLALFFGMKGLWLMQSTFGAKHIGVFGGLKVLFAALLIFSVIPIIHASLDLLYLGQIYAEHLL